DTATPGSPAAARSTTAQSVPRCSSRAALPPAASAGSADRASGPAIGVNLRHHPIPARRALAITSAPPDGTAGVPARPNAERSSALLTGAEPRGDPALPGPRRFDPRGRKRTRLPLRNFAVVPRRLGPPCQRRTAPLQHPPALSA